MNDLFLKSGVYAPPPCNTTCSSNDRSYVHVLDDDGKVM